MKGKCGKGKSGPIGRIEETPWTPPPGQYHPRETEAVSPPPPTEQSLPETTLETELESMMDEMEAGQAAHHAADPTPTPTPSVPTPVLTPQSSAPATPRVPDPEASPPTEGQTEKTDDGEEAEEEKERNDKACFFGDMVNLQYAYIEIYIYIYTSAYPLIKTQCRLPGRCEAIFDHAIDWDWTNPNNQRFSSSWARWKATTCDLVHGVSSPCARDTYYIYIYIHLFSILFQYC